MQHTAKGIKDPSKEIILKIVKLDDNTLVSHIKHDNGIFFRMIYCNPYQEIDLKHLYLYSDTKILTVSKKIFVFTNAFDIHIWNNDKKTIHYTITPKSICNKWDTIFSKKNSSGIFIDTKVLNDNEIAILSDHYDNRHPYGEKLQFISIWNIKNKKISYQKEIYGELENIHIMNDHVIAYSTRDKNFKDLNLHVFDVKKDLFNRNRISIKNYNHKFRDVKLVGVFHYDKILAVLTTENTSMSNNKEFSTRLTILSCDIENITNVAVENYSDFPDDQVIFDNGIIILENKKEHTLRSATINHKYDLTFDEVVKQTNFAKLALIEMIENINEDSEKKSGVINNDSAARKSVSKKVSQDTFLYCSEPRFNFSPLSTKPTVINLFNIAKNNHIHFQMDHQSFVILINSAMILFGHHLCVQSKKSVTIINAKEQTFSKLAANKNIKKMIRLANEKIAIIFSHNQNTILKNSINSESCYAMPYLIDNESNDYLMIYDVVSLKSIFKEAIVINDKWLNFQDINHHVLAYITYDANHVYKLNLIDFNNINCIKTKSIEILHDLSVDIKDTNIYFKDNILCLSLIYTINTNSIHQQTTDVFIYDLSNGDFDALAFKNKYTFENQKISLENKSILDRENNTVMFFMINEKFEMVEILKIENKNISECNEIILNKKRNLIISYNIYTSHFFATHINPKGELVEQVKYTGIKNSILKFSDEEFVFENNKNEHIRLIFNNGVIPKEIAHEVISIAKNVHANVNRFFVAPDVFSFNAEKTKYHDENLFKL